MPIAFNVNDPASYNHSTSTSVYDSLGVSHVSTMYFRKSASLSDCSFNPILRYFMALLLNKAS